MRIDIALIIPILGAGWLKYAFLSKGDPYI